MKLFFLNIFVFFTIVSFAQISVKGASDVTTKTNNQVTFERKELDFTKIRVEESGKRFVSGNIEGTKVEQSDESIRIVINPLSSKTTFDTKPAEKKQILIGLGEPIATKPAIETTESKLLAELRNEIILLKKQNEALQSEVEALKKENAALVAAQSKPEVAETIPVSPPAKKAEKVTEKKVEAVAVLEPQSVPAPKVVEQKAVETKAAPEPAKVAQPNVAAKAPLQVNKVYAMQDILSQNHLGIVFFERNSINFKENYTNELQKIADFLAKNPKAKIAINSYITTESASDNYSPVLANVRASQVMTKLIETYSIPKEKLDIVIVDKHRMDETLKGCISFSAVK